MTRVSAIKGLDHYDHRLYFGGTDETRGFYVQRRGSATFIELADDFYIRRATSSPGKWRIVLPNYGITRVFTIDSSQARDIMRNSGPYPDGDE